MNPYVAIPSMVWLLLALWAWPAYTPWLSLCMVSVWLATAAIFCDRPWWTNQNARLHQTIRETLVLMGGDLTMTTEVDGDPREQKILQAGEGFTRVLGWSVEEMEGQPWASFVHPEDLYSAAGQASRLALGKTINKFVTRWRKKEKTANGQDLYMWLEWTAISREGVTQALARDISDNVRREALISTWARVTTDLMSVADMTVPVPERKFTWINQAWSRQLGWTHGELMTMKIVDLLHPTEAPEVITRRERDETYRDPGSIVTRARVRLKPVSGEPPKYRWYEWTALHEGQWLYTSGRDVEVERQAQVEADAALADLRARNADLENFANVAAHQLRSPPRTISGVAKALKEDYADVLDADGMEFLEDIRNDAAYMAEVVDGLYRFSKVRTGENLQVKPVDLATVVRRVYDLWFKRHGRPSTVKIEVDEMPVVLGDALLLAEVFHNLLDNGMKFNESKSKVVHISAERTENRWLIRVRDNGIGIDPVYNEKLFKMFERMHPSYPGTGVGLALVAAIIARHGGTIRLEESSHEGSTFAFDLEPAWTA